jgi:hypothetical protein
MRLVALWRSSKASFDDEVERRAAGRNALYRIHQQLSEGDFNVGQ